MFIQPKFASLIFLLIASAISHIHAHPEIPLTEYVLRYETAQLTLTTLSLLERDYNVTIANETIKGHLECFNQTIEFFATRSTEFIRTEVEVHEQQTGPRVRDFDIHFYEFDDGNTSVLGYRSEDGRFTGMITRGNVTYYMEPADRYVTDQEVTGGTTNTIVYRNIDVNHAKLRSFINRKPKMPVNPSTTANETGDTYTTTEIMSDDHHHPLTPSSGMVTTESTSAACEIEMVADWTLLEWFHNKWYDVAAFMVLHAKFADKIFRSLDLAPFEIRIIPKQLVIYEHKHTADYPFRNTTSTLDEFLEQATKRLSKGFCLSIYFCTRRFTTSAIGESWLASHGSEGGICGRPVALKDKTLHSYNIGALSTISWDGFRMPMAATLMSFVHELGHSFGADHDPRDSSLCGPRGKSGYYVMDRTLHLRGYFKDIFSPCSMHQMRRIVSERAGRCLTFDPVPNCGNGIRETGEECDCGTNEVCEILDECCSPRGGIGGDPGCTYRRKSGFLCSKVDDPCCTGKCTIAAAGTRCIARVSECVTSECDGKSASCQKKLLADGTPCKGTSKTCYSGFCNSTFCHDQGLQECVCTGRRACEVCCRDLRKATSTCSPAGLFDPKGSFRFLPAGTRCESDGRCNGHGKCSQLKSPDVAKPEIFTKEQNFALWMSIGITTGIFVLVCGVIIILSDFLRKRRSSASRALL